MPSPIMFTEAAFLYDPILAARRPMPCRAGRQFETLAKMSGVDIDRLAPATVREAMQTCSHCASRKACRRWLRTGVFDYAGDPRCPNVALLRH